MHALLSCLRHSAEIWRRRLVKIPLLLPRIWLRDLSQRSPPAGSPLYTLGKQDGWKG